MLPLLSFLFYHHLSETTKMPKIPTEGIIKRYDLFFNKNRTKAIKSKIYFKELYKNNETSNKK